MTPNKWGPEETVRAWAAAGVTSAMRKELEEECERSMHQLMQAAKSSTDGRVRECLARYQALSTVVDALVKARSVKDDADSGKR